MKDLLEFIISNITGDDKFSIETETNEGIVNLNLFISKDLIGIIIGKEGKTIKNIRRIISILGVKEGKSVNINVSEKI